MAITAKDVAKLRNMTGAGMMDCKKALSEANGDFEAAVDFLRKKGQKVANKRADRDAKEGTVFIQGSGDTAVIIELNCETDFVAKNDDFQALGNNILEIAIAEKPTDLAALRALPMGEQPISEHLVDAMGKIGEKIDLSVYERIVGTDVVTYLHPGGRIGVAVSFENVNGGDVALVGKDIAMQITAMNPVAIDKGDVPEEIIQKEIQIGKEQALEQGKPENIVEKIAMGKTQ